MDNIYTLSPNEAIQYFIQNSREVILAEPTGYIAVSIIVPAEDTTLDPDEGSISLQGRLDEIERKLKRKYNNPESQKVMANLRELQRKIEHHPHLDTLVIYANEQFAAVTHLAIRARAESFVGTHFDLRPLYQAKQELEHYYLMLISKKKIRLLEVLKDKLVREIKDDNFPFENTDHSGVEKEKAEQDVFTDNQIKEFFNIADKRFQKYWKANKHPLVLAGDKKTLSYYAEMMDDDRMLIGKLPGNFVNTSYQQLIERAYPIVEEYNDSQQKAYLKSIINAQFTGKLENDPQEIYQLILQGNADTLFIGENFSLQGKVEKNHLLLNSEHSSLEDAENIAIDFLHSLRKNGGKVVFLKDEVLAACPGIALIKRY